MVSRHLSGTAPQNQITFVGFILFNNYILNSKFLFTITAEIHARSLANFYCQYADKHMNVKFMRRVGERERAIRQFVIVKNKLMSACNASVLLLTMNFFMTLSKQSTDPLGHRLVDLQLL